MGQVRSVLLKLHVSPAGRACNCKRNSNHRIARGEPRLVVRNPGMAAGEAGYCAPCGRLMLEQARDELEQLMRQVPS